MAKANKTPQKHRLNGNSHGKGFTSERQPSSEAKKDGWKEWRKRRLLTQGILKLMINKAGKPTKAGKDYFKALLDLAKEGNATAINTINNAFEEQVQKSEVTHKLGKDLADEEWV